MNVKKLFQVLVIGGAALGAGHCGPAPQDNQQGLNNNGGPIINPNPDGGTFVDDGGDPGGGGPPGW